LTLSSRQITKLLFSGENPAIVAERLDALRASLVSATLQVDTLLDNVPNIEQLRNALWNMQKEIDTIKAGIVEKTVEN
jgi:hypothetical protein